MTGGQNAIRAGGALCAALFVVVAADGCSAPVSVKQLSPQNEYVRLSSNALTDGEVSDATQIVLRRYNLVEAFEQDPPVAITTLRNVVVIGRGGNDELFALAELSALYAQRTASRADAMAAALYAFAFLFPEQADERPEAIDPRYRWACDIYAAALTQALRSEDGKTVTLAAGVHPLPFGSIAVTFDPEDLQWGGRTLTDFLPVAQYEVIGMRNRYRHPGIGVPLAAKTEEPEEDDEKFDLVGKRVRVPVTALLQFDDPRKQIVTTALQGHLDLFADTEHEAIDIDGQLVPLEIDRTAAVAVTLSETAFWNQELSSFLGDVVGVRKTAHLSAAEPYRPDRIPVVFVHGTNSSPGRWADMVNDLENDPLIRNQYQFWYFSYDSGNPIAYSAMLLRRALKEAVAQYDPHGRDPCLHDMVVIGHSQGGLLTKMTAIDSGDAFWQDVSHMPLDEVRISDKSRALIQEALFLKPLPFVTRVVFIATPHGGSYLAGSELVRRLAEKLISMPRDLTAVGTDLVAVRDPAKRMITLERFPTSIDNMSVGNPFIKTLSGIPVAPGVHAHSIIPVEGDGPLMDEVDGVVAYKSAHIEGVESERVIQHSSHSTQSNPDTVDEVRRILLLHAELAPCCVPGANAGVPCRPSAP